MTILVQQQLREATERLIAEGENCWPATVERFNALANPAAVLALLDEIDRLQAELEEERQLRAKVGRIAHYLNEFANKRTTFSRIQEINDAIQEVPDGH